MIKEYIRAALCRWLDSPVMLIPAKDNILTVSVMATRFNDGIIEVQLQSFLNKDGSWFQIPNPAWMRKGDSLLISNVDGNL